ncbi:hypothetical protein HGQ85_19325 [Clostridioides difficile]|nr:hypothetical protein [Clostridioides difficile]
MCIRDSIYTIFLLLIGWTLFAITDFNGICEYLSKLFFYSNGEEWIYYLRNYGVSLIIAIIFSLPLVSMFYKKIENFKWIKTIILMGIFIISVAYLVDATYNPFLYFRF